MLENLDGELKILLNSRFVDYKEITDKTLEAMREKKANNEKDSSERPKQPWKPPEDHPWRGKNRVLFAESNE